MMDYNKLLRDKLMSKIQEKNEGFIYGDLSWDKSFNTTWIYDEGCNIEFRYCILDNQIIVSRVCFEKRRNDCMSGCFEILKEFGEYLGYNEIVIQSVLTYEMASWCKDHDFTPKGYSIDIGEVFVGDYDFFILGREDNQKE